MSHELDEWRHAVRDMSETERLSTVIDVRTTAGLNPYDGPDE